MVSDYNKVMVLIYMIHCVAPCKQVELRYLKTDRPFSGAANFGRSVRFAFAMAKGGYRTMGSGDIFRRTLGSSNPAASLCGGKAAAIIVVGWKCPPKAE